MTQRVVSFGSLPAVLLTVLALTTSCGAEKRARDRIGEKAAEEVLNQATGGEADVDLDQGGKRVTITTKSGSTELAEASEWPADMFPEVPCFENGRVTHVTRGDESGLARFNVLFNEVEEGALAGYSDALQAAGWEAQTVNMGPKGGLITGQKGDLGLNFTVSGDRHEAVLAVFRAGGGD